MYMHSFSNNCEKRGGVDNFCIRRWKLWDCFANYLSVKLVKTCDLSPKDQYLFAAHPHAILPFGFAFSFLREGVKGGREDLFPGIIVRPLAASICFWVPLYRELFLYAGIVDVSKSSAEYIIKKGQSIVIVPGGTDESLHASSEEDVLVLHKRRGFIKLAMKYGLKIVPIFTFNECNYFRQKKAPKWFERFRKVFQKATGMTIPIPANIWPKKSVVTTVVGSPLDIPKMENPQKKDIDHYLNLYIQKVKELHREYSPIYSTPSNKKLRIL